MFPMKDRLIMKKIFIKIQHEVLKERMLNKFKHLSWHFSVEVNLNTDTNYNLFLELNQVVFIFVMN